MARRSAQPCLSSHLLFEGAAPLGAPWWRFRIPGPRFLIPAWLPPLRGASSAHRLVAPCSVGNLEQSQSSEAPRRGVVVPPGRVPGPPEYRLTRPIRGRHIDQKRSPAFGSGTSDAASPAPSPSGGSIVGTSRDDAPRLSRTFGTICYAGNKVKRRAVARYGQVLPSRQTKPGALRPRLPAGQSSARPAARRRARSPGRSPRWSRPSRNRPATVRRRTRPAPSSRRSENR
jgi:hypothetical protein